MEQPDTNVVIPDKTIIQEQNGGLLSSIPKRYQEKVGIKKGVKLSWILKQNKRDQYYLVAYVAEEDKNAEAD